MAIVHAQNGACSKAWALADTARTAARCALQAHEALWNLSGGKLTEKEQAAFEKAEIAQQDAARAERAAAAQSSFPAATWAAYSVRTAG